MTCRKPKTTGALLLALSGGEAGPWALSGPDDKPAFMQPPAPKGLNWTPVATPDALDLLITSRNHDLKQQIARHAEPQDWVFALVSLQTSEGYGGAGNNGIARMNGGSSSRPLLGISLLPMPCQRQYNRDGREIRAQNHDRYILQCQMGKGRV